VGRQRTPPPPGQIEAGGPEVVELEAKVLGLSTAEGGALGTMS
jgi:hypothetical protein